MESDLQQRGRKLDDLNRQLKVMEVDAASRQSAFTEQLKEKRQSYSNAIKAYWLAWFRLQSTLGKRTAAYSQERNSLEYTIKELKFSIESIRK
mgnify:CR=1 FL=1